MLTQPRLGKVAIIISGTNRSRQRASQKCCRLKMHARMYTHTHGWTTQKHNASGPNCWMGGGIKLSNGREFKHYTRQCGQDFVPTNIKYDFNKRTLLLVHLFIMSKFYVFVLCGRIYCINCFFFIHNVVCLLSCVNMWACHVYFTTNLLIYLHLTM